ncbi:T9SS type A sorting domain-containing protein [Psychroserpens algicola]|uniref:T9SS type A sorting domain-containing protein n=1 Tax=Psychroserpens algicola TaxID=1719034 RepID=UPI0019544F45|nr:T9SS type A sorting domain-containing protein [Psychroserpens algicola]
MVPSKLLSFLFFLSCMLGFAQVPTNNECANAEIITVTTSSILTISADFTNATESLDASCNTVSTNNKDLWYQFTMPVDGILHIDGPSSLNYFTLYEICGGAEIACSKDDAVFGNLIAGNSYLLRTSYQFNGSVNIGFQVFEPAANDDCANREILTVTTDDFIQPNPDSRSASFSSNSSCDVSNINYADLWYEFEMPVDGNLEISSSQSSQIFSLYDACSGTELQCFSGNGLFQNLSSNTSYVLRVAERVTDVGIMNFRLKAYAYAVNNNCNASQTIIVETSNANAYTADLRTASESLVSSCETTSTTNFDLWFNFTMPVTGNLKIDQLIGLDTITIYDTCGGVELSCQKGLQFISGLVENTNYIVRISSVSQVNKVPRFQAFEQALNDECANSETISVATENALSYQADTRKASQSLLSSCDNTNDNSLDLWYDFVMPVTGNIQISGVSFTFRTSLYDACSGVELDCINGNGTYFNLGINTNYKLRVSQLTTSAAAVNFNIQAFENLFNDECVTPLDLTLIENEFTTYTTNNAAATNSTLSACEPSSENITIQDVWYRFTMPSDTDVEIDHLTSSINGYYALYDSCGNNELQCFTNDGYFNDLIGGNEYYLKVGKLSSQAGILSFNISAKSKTLSVEESLTEGLSVYPNPVENVVHISTGNDQIIDRVSIYDITGQLIKSVLYTQLSNPIDVDISDLASAHYFMIISLNDHKQMIHRMIKK